MARNRLAAGSGPSSARGRLGDRRGHRVLGCLLHRAGLAEQLLAADPSAAATSATAITPVVTVPVLSSTTVSTAREDSSAW